MLRDRGTPQGPLALGGGLCYSGVRSRLLVFARVLVHGGSGGALSLLGDIQSHLENLLDSVPCLSGLATLSVAGAVQSPDDLHVEGALIRLGLIRIAAEVLGNQVGNRTRLVGGILIEGLAEGAVIIYLKGLDAFTNIQKNTKPLMPPNVTRSI